MQGRLDTFFRPAPVDQPAYTEIKAKVAPNQFVGRRVLVIGGTRGTGETTAKILAAGGAQVIITYNRGEHEARLIQDEIRGAAGRCEIVALNVLEPVPDEALLFPDGHPPSQIFFFASPHIRANKGKNWDPDLHQYFCRFYLQAFSEIVGRYAQAAAASDSSVEFFYPSSVYVEDAERGFAEYAVAKAAGEALCVQLADRYPNCRFVAPRLPRMATDQTSSIVPVESDSTFDVMYQWLNGAH